MHREIIELVLWVDRLRRLFEKQGGNQLISWYSIVWKNGMRNQDGKIDMVSPQNVPV